MLEAWVQSSAVKREEMLLATGKELASEAAN
jgi:hypothetical protein